MPRPSKDLSRIAPTDLAYAVSRLIANGKTSAAEVRKLAAERPARIAAIQRELQALQGGQPGSVATKRGPGRPPGLAKAASKPKRKFTVTPKVRAARKIQGQYLGLLKKLKGAARANVRALAKKESVAAAVKLARKLAK